jgi:hypothetical protein
MLPNANIRNDVFLVFYSFKQNIIKTILEKIIRDVGKYDRGSLDRISLD